MTVYVDFVNRKTRVHAGCKDPSKAPTVLVKNVPIYGPRFTPPSYLDIQRRQAVPLITPTYLQPLNVIHPFYYQNLGKCPQCGSNDTNWASWTGTGPRDVHGVRREERALGYQIRCKPCLKKYGKDGTHEKEKKNHCFATTNQAFWANWQHWEIPRTLASCNRYLAKLICLHPKVAYLISSADALSLVNFGI